MREWDAVDGEGGHTSGSLVLLCCYCFSGAFGGEHPKTFPL